MTFSRHFSNLKTQIRNLFIDKALCNQIINISRDYNILAKQDKLGTFVSLSLRKRYASLIKYCSDYEKSYIKLQLQAIKSIKK